MEPPDTQATNSTLALLEYYKWKKFSIVTQKDAQWQTIAKHLRYQAEIKNFTINHYEEFVDYRTCCNKGLNCCTKVSNYKTFLFVSLKLLVYSHQLFYVYFYYKYELHEKFQRLFLTSLKATYLFDHQRSER